MAEEFDLEFVVAVELDDAPEFEFPLPTVEPLALNTGLDTDELFEEDPVDTDVLFRADESLVCA